MKTEAVVLPHDPRWNEARVAWNLAVDQQPAAVALPESAEDVIAVVRWARSRGLRVAPQGTGHNAAAMGSLAHTVLVKTESACAASRSTPKGASLELRPASCGPRSARQPPSTGLRHSPDPRPMSASSGTRSAAGSAGLRVSYGLAANSVTAVELVNADGELVRADADNESELFWALRGGGGSFGVVTALEFQLYPIAEVYAGVLFFPIERGKEVLHAWRRWLEDVPDEVTSVGRFLQFPPIPDIPEPLRGGSFVVVEATSLLDEAATDELLRPLRELGPAMDTFATIPIERLSSLHMDPEHPVPGAADGMLLRGFPGGGDRRHRCRRGCRFRLAAPLRRGASPRRRTRPHAAGPRSAGDDRSRIRDVRRRNGDDSRAGCGREGAHRDRPGGAGFLGRGPRLPQLHRAS